MGDVINLPGSFNPDLEEPTDPQEVLRGVAALNLRDVAVVAREGNGAIVVFASQVDADTTIGLLMRGVQFLSESEQIPFEGDEIPG